MDTLKEIINSHLGIAFHNVLIVGSSKIGCSLAPYKNFKKFDPEGNSPSDIDIALISLKLFNELWDNLRKGQYKTSDKLFNNRIKSSIYRGFLNEKDFLNIDDFRPFWNNQIDKVNKSIQTNLPIYHQINYRVYRSWEDLEDYHIIGLKELKTKIL